MKKELITVFSLSITAGTLYLTYSKIKSYKEKKLVDSWVEGMKVKNASLTAADQTFLMEELDKLPIWELIRLAKYSDLFLKKAPATVTGPLLERLRAKTLLKINLKRVELILAP